MKHPSTPIAFYILLGLILIYNFLAAAAERIMIVVIRIVFVILRDMIQPFVSNSVLTLLLNMFFLIPTVLLLVPSVRLLIPGAYPFYRACLYLMRIRINSSFLFTTGNFIVAGTTIHTIIISCGIYCPPPCCCNCSTATFGMVPCNMLP
jgi:hypothetical protein